MSIPLPPPPNRIVKTRLKSDQNSMVEGEKKPKIMDEESHNQKLPLIGESSTPNNARANLIQQAIRQTFKSVDNLANLLPTGTVLLFQLLSPICTNQGQCDDASKYLTEALVIFCGLSCFLSCFTDSFRDDKGAVHYGIATFNGLWIIDGSTTVPPDQAPQFRLKFIDFLHAFMSTLVFAAIALLDQNVVNCFYPAPSQETMEILTAIPVGVGMISSGCFVTFPSTRYGFGRPLTTR